ncbi:MAG: MaoC family dehydratase N-terminal domain-containing protein [Alphaproteobacteria bacterium]|nr:MaoC family dehydratase N-terminal domain-containing protein [Alphaproteobacteria bacterium]
MDVIGLGSCWEELSVGMKYRSVGRTISETDLMAFLGLTGMNEVIFTDDEFRAEHSVIKEKFCPGALAYTIAEGLLIPTMQGTGMAFLNMELNMEGPCFVGDTIYVEAEVLEVRESSKGGYGIVRTKNTVKKTDGSVILTYTPLRMLKGRAKRDEVAKSILARP